MIRDPETWDEREWAVGRFCTRNDPHEPHRVEWAEDGKAHLWDCPGVELLTEQDSAG